MKRITTIAFIIAITLTQVIAQDSLYNSAPPVKTPERNKDRFLISTYNCFWQGLADGVSQRAISQGYNISLIYDIPTSDKSPISFGLGLGYSRNNFYSNATLNRDLRTGAEVLTPIPDGVKYNTNKLAFSYLNIPLEVRFRSANNIRVALGLRSSLKIDAFTKFYGHNPDATIYGPYDQLKIINHDISNAEKYAFELTARVGWKFVSINGSYQLNSVFVADKGPQINPYTLGVTLSLW